MPIRRQFASGRKQPMMASSRSGSSMTRTKTALYRASLLTDNVGIRLCLAAMLVMPSALVFLSPVFGLLDVAGDDLLAFGLAHDGSWTSALAALALCVGFSGAWMRILSPGSRLLRRPGQRRFVLAALSLGTLTLAVALAVRATGGSADDDGGWLLLAAFAAHLFLLAGTFGQPRPARLNRI
jgi:hypothetical protein